MKVQKIILVCYDLQTKTVIALLIRLTPEPLIENRRNLHIH